MLEDYKSGVQLRALTLNRHQIPSSELHPVLLKLFGLKQPSAAGAAFKWSEQKQTPTQAKCCAYLLAITKLVNCCLLGFPRQQEKKWMGHSVQAQCYSMQAATSTWDVDSRLPGNSENPSCNFPRSKRKPGTLFWKGVIPLGRAALFPELFLTPGWHCQTLTSFPEAMFPKPGVL